MILEFEDFLDKYQPLKNHLSEGAFNGYMFETYGKEFDFVNTHSNKNIWTVVQGDYEDLWLVPGKVLVNRLGFMISNKEWEDELEEYCLEEYITIGHAKRLTRDFMEDVLEMEFTDKMEDKLHDYYAGKCYS